MFALLKLVGCLLQIEVSSGTYLAHVSAKQQQAAAEGQSAFAPSHEVLIRQLGELDKLGQEGAALIDDAEVRCTAVQHHSHQSHSEGQPSTFWWFDGVP